MRLLILPLAAIALVSCTVPTPADRSAAIETGSDLTTVKIPVLRSPWLESRWGAPQVATRADGGYRLTYRQGTSLNYVFIHGVMKPSPVPDTAPDMQEDSFAHNGEPVSTHHKQSWRQATVLGKGVKWYQNDAGGGADFPCYKTVDFPLTAPDGRSGHYRIEVCTDEESKAAEWITKVSW